MKSISSQVISSDFLENNENIASINSLFYNGERGDDTWLI